MRKSVRLFAAAAILSLTCCALPARAITTTPQVPASSSAPDIIAMSIVANGAQLENIELYNQSDTPVALSNWRIVTTIKGAGDCGTPQTVTNPIASEWILPKHYFTVEPSVSVPPDCTKLADIEIRHNDSVVQKITIADTTLFAADKVYQHKQRANSPSSTRTVSGSFETDYTKIVAAAQATLYSDPLYMPPVTNAGLQILEILPHARDCAPNEDDLTCGDYIKVYNPTNTALNLAAYRLRVGHKGQSESTTNLFSWGRTIDPSSDELLLSAHSYLTINARNDGQALSLTDTGNYVWLEDAYGVAIYEPILSYPDASSTTKVGKSWAFDGSAWRWSSSPQPNAPNYFPLEPAATSAATTETQLRPCASNQYRSPETNRCRTLATTSSMPAPCKENQERNPETNRCRSTTAGATGPKPCGANEERNPETNRCRKIATTTSGHVKGASQTTQGAGKYTWIIAIAAIAAISYAIYEWRQDIALWLTRLKAKSAALARRLKH